MTGTMDLIASRFDVAFRIADQASTATGFDWTSRITPQLFVGPTVTLRAEATGELSHRIVSRAWELRKLGNDGEAHPTVLVTVLADGTTEAVFGSCVQPSREKLSDLVGMFERHRA